MRLTVDSFQNSTAASISTAVTIVGNLGADAATTVFATSDGTGVVSTNDQWIGVDDAIDGGGTPAVISYIRGPSGLAPTVVSLTGDNLSWTYSLTVPAGQTVNLATLTIQSMSRATAIAEANALVAAGGFGGEAGVLLASPQSATPANFNFGALTVTSTSVDSGVLVSGNNSLTVAFNKPVIGAARAGELPLAVSRTGWPAGHCGRHHHPHNVGRRGQPRHNQFRNFDAGHLSPHGPRCHHRHSWEPALRQRFGRREFHSRLRRRAPSQQPLRGRIDLQH